MLEHLDLRADSRLRHTERLRSLGETSHIDHADQRAQQFSWNIDHHGDGWIIPHCQVKCRMFVLLSDRIPAITFGLLNRLDLRSLTDVNSIEHSRTNILASGGKRFGQAKGPSPSTKKE